MVEPGLRTYATSDVVVVHRTRDAFGGLSNMAAGFPLRIGDLTIRTAEALYQACRFPHDPELQDRILEARSPMTAKQISRAQTSRSRGDWLHVRVATMRWCLRVKLACAPTSFAAVLRATSGRPIVERSAHDDFWGAIEDRSVLTGRNVLGRLLMELRAQLEVSFVAAEVVPAPCVPGLLLLGRQVPPVPVMSEDLALTNRVQPALPHIDPQEPR
jgi:ribA/ribD-fused uncharacterized protein